MAFATSTIIAAIGLAIAGAGAVTQYVGAQKAAKAQQRQEGIRKQQMNLDYARRRREMIRKAMIAQATGISNATTQGAAASDSAVQGGIAQATQNANLSVLGADQNMELGENMFSANAQEAKGSGISNLGGAMKDWGSGIINNSTKISRVGSSFGLWSNGY